MSYCSQLPENIRDKEASRKFGDFQQTFDIFPQIFARIYYHQYKRDSLACAARLAGGALAPGLTLINYKEDNISKHVY